MSLSPTQLEVLDKIEAWHKKAEACSGFKDADSPQVFKLMGYAGTGKTTLAKELLNRIDGQINFAAYTGKAASVLAKKGCVGAQTIHSLIYLVQEKGKSGLKDLEQVLADTKKKLSDIDILPPPTPLAQDFGQFDKQALKERLTRDIVSMELQLENEKKTLGRPSFVLNPESLVRNASLIVLDEVSMVAQDMGEDLMSFGVPILVIGDPAQLPPVFGNGFFVQGKPDVLLTEIHRQAQDNPLIQLASKVREEKPLRPGSYGPNKVLLEGEKLDEDVLNFDQILVGKNTTRKMMNARIREIMGFKEWHPIPGDKLICLKNDKELGLQNGTLWKVLQLGNVDEHRITITIADDSGYEIPVEIHAAPFLGKEIPFYEKSEAHEFDFGYAITVHKSQGSQWEKVLLCDESFCFKQNRFKWLYTGLTRASERVTVLQL